MAKRFLKLIAVIAGSCIIPYYISFFYPDKEFANAHEMAWLYRWAIGGASCLLGTMAIVIPCFLVYRAWQYVVEGE